MKAALPINESDRIRTLRMYRILDTASESCFDELTRLAAIICEVPIATISLIDENRQWFKSQVGLNVDETPRDISFCSHAILNEDITVIPDATLDKRVADSPLVTSNPHIRFYAGAPLLVPEGVPLGMFCVIDRKPRSLTTQQLDALSILSRAVVTQLQLRRAMEDLQAMARIIPMCAWCRKIRRDDGTWAGAGDYIEQSADVSHGICQTCHEQLTGTVTAA